MKSTNNYDEDDIIYLASKFKVLSEPSRLKILSFLSKGEKCVSEITDALNLSQSNISKQLKILTSNEIIKFQPRGLQRYYLISDKEIMKLCNMICKNRSKE